MATSAKSTRGRRNVRRAELWAARADIARAERRRLARVTDDQWRMLFGHPPRQETLR